MQIMTDWQNQRFVVLTGLISDIGILLSDVSYWAEHQPELSEWCAVNHARQEGMLVIFPDPKTLTAFCLRWS